VAEGDLLFGSLEEVREHFARQAEDSRFALVVATRNGVDIRWSPQKQNNIIYCVSPNFDLVIGLAGAQSALQTALRTAIGDWQSAANLTFVGPSMGACDFTVAPVTGLGGFGVASFPDQPNRVLLVDTTAFLSASPPLVGVLRHELGHILGFRHENAAFAPDGGFGGCAEPLVAQRADGVVIGGRVVSSVSNDSVMFTPVGGCLTTNFAKTISASDAAGAAAVYGAVQAPQPVCGHVNFMSPEPCCATGMPCESRILYGDQMFGCRNDILLTPICSVSRNGQLVVAFQYLRSNLNVPVSWSGFSSPEPNQIQYSDLQRMAPLWANPSQPTYSELWATLYATQIQLVNEAQVLSF
jgi:hypothetical protein